MGVLRSDRVSGLGGANAITGSAHFQGGDGAGTAWLRYIDAGVSEDYNFGTGDFTIECWINRKVLTNDDVIWGTTLSESSGTGLFWYFNGSHNLRTVENGTTRQSTSNSISAGTWYHVALTRASGTLQMWVDGVSKYSAGSVTGTIGSSTQNFIIGDGNTGYAGNDYQFLGHISNLRIQKGKAEYTAAFTPPTTKLEVTPETVLLCCHDPGNVLAEATGKTLTLVKSKSQTVGGNSAGIVASRFTPDKGEDHGTTFADGAVFDTLSYMVPPGGTTTQSNRGRGVFAGGETPSKVNSIEYINIQSMGTTKDFGDLITVSGDVKGLGSSTRGVFRVDNNPTSRNVLEYITFATTSNATDFGDLFVAIQQRPGASNQTRGIFSGGLYPGSSMHSDMDYITIATLANAADFGNLSVARGDASALASPTRMVVAGGITNPGSVTYMVDVDYVEIATLSSAIDFGDLNTGKRSGTAVANSTRGVFGPGKAPSVSDVIDYITIATTGTVTDFGDASVARGGAGSASNSIRGLFAGGYSPSLINGIEFITIATTGNGADFGDMTFVSQYGGGCSDSHGGIA